MESNADIKTKDIEKQGIILFGCLKKEFILFHILLFTKNVPLTATRVTTLSFIEPGTHIRNLALADLRKPYILHSASFFQFSFGIY